MLPKHEKRYCKRTCAHMRCDILSPFTQLHVFGWPPSPQYLRTYLIDGPFLNQNTFKDIQILNLRKYRHLKKNKFLHEKD